MNRQELDRELLARGLESADLVAITGLSAATLSRLRGGHPVTATTMRRLVAGLERVPVSPLARALLSDDDEADR